MSPAVLEWERQGLFTAAFAALLSTYHRRRGIQWEWGALDAVIVKAPKGPKGGDLTGPNPTDRAKPGVTRRVLTDARGVPLSVILSAANVHDAWSLARTLDAVVLRAARGTRRPEHCCLV